MSKCGRLMNMGILNRRSSWAAMILVAAVLPAVSAAADNDAKGEYRQAVDHAGASYRAQQQRCASLAGNDRDICLEQAQAERKRAEAEALARLRNTPKARVEARIAIADAEYAVARARCKAQHGNDRDICMQQAKASNTALKADARSDLRVTEARNKARDEKRDAYYKAEAEKCDALKDAARDACITLAKSHYGK
jgi:hypothetical protein